MIQEMIKRRDLAVKRAARLSVVTRDVAGPIAAGRGVDRTSGGDDVTGGYHVDDAQTYHARAEASH